MKVLWGVSGLVLGASGGYWAGRGAGSPDGGGMSGRETSAVDEAGAEGRAAGSAGVGTSKLLAAKGQAKDGKEGGVLSQLKGLSPGQALHKILLERDAVKRLAVIREWSAGMEPEEMLLVIKEFRDMVEAQKGGAEMLGMFFLSMDVMGQGMVDRGAADVLKVLLKRGESLDDKENQTAEGLSTQIFKKWAEQDPAAARALLEARLSAGGKIGRVEREFSKDLMRAWVKTEPEAAMAWLLKQPEELQQVSIGGAFQSLSHTDPEKALRMVEAQADLPGRAEIAGTIAEWWAKTSPDKALEWAKGLPEVLAGRSVRQAMSSWAEKDLAGAKEALDGLGWPLRQEALPAVLGHWEKGKWSEAAAFLESQPMGSGREAATMTMVREWAGADQQAASSWLAGQPAGAERDAGVLGLLEEVRRTDPEAAAVWGATLGDEKDRRDSLKTTMQRWYGTSVPEALDWLRTTKEITDSDRAFLLGEMPGKGE